MRSEATGKSGEEKLPAERITQESLSHREEETTRGARKDATSVCNSNEKRVKANQAWTLRGKKYRKTYKEKQNITKIASVLGRGCMDR